jgi:hypothetical protein
MACSGAIAGRVPIDGPTRTQNGVACYRVASLHRRFARKTAFPAISFPSGRFRSPSKTHSGGIPNRFLQVAVSKTLRQSRVAPTIKPHLPERFRYSPRTLRQVGPVLVNATAFLPSGPGTGKHYGREEESCSTSHIGTTGQRRGARRVGRSPPTLRGHGQRLDPGVAGYTSDPLRQSRVRRSIRQGPGTQASHRYRKPSISIRSVSASGRVEYMRNLPSGEIDKPRAGSTSGIWSEVVVPRTASRNAIEARRLAPDFVT